MGQGLCSRYWCQNYEKGRRNMKFGYVFVLIMELTSLCWHNNGYCVRWILSIKLHYLLLTFVPCSVVLSMEQNIHLFFLLCSVYFRSNYFGYLLFLPWKLYFNYWKLPYYYEFPCKLQSISLCGWWVGYNFVTFAFCKCYFRFISVWQKFIRDDVTVISLLTRDDADYRFVNWPISVCDF